MPKREGLGLFIIDNNEDPCIDKISVIATAITNKKSGPFF
jgi:hypothetical protein